MERNFTNENFERFLRQNADGLRMRPSDKVWSGISRNLNRRKRRFGFLLLTSLMIATGLGYHYTAHAPRINTPASFTQPSVQNSLTSKETPSATRSVGSRFTEGRHQTAASIIALAPPERNESNNGTTAMEAVNQEKQQADPDNTSISDNKSFQNTIVDSYT